VDAAVGGTGFLDRGAYELHLMARRAIDHLDHPNCESACYRCLKSYYNQRFHQHLNWPRILPDLKDLGEAAPTPVSGETTSDDYDPWLDAYAAGVGSPLELKFLRLFEAHGLAIEKQVPVAAEPNQLPIRIADFVVSGSRVAIYVDGAVFHIGSRLRRDRFFRDRLRAGSGAWTIAEFGAQDLGRGSELVQELKNLASRAPN
jgi:hypothetical protein